MKKYGLQLRVPPPQQKKQPTRPPLPPPRGFDDDEEDNVEREISRQAMKNRALKEVEEQHKKALEEDPSAFDYDGVYDEMKDKALRPRAQDREERKPKYIQNLMKKAEQRQREQEIVYERKLAKERSKDEHLYAEKDKFVTGAYKRKLAEQAKWMEEERLRQLREEKDDVTKKSDISDFYFNLEKNVAFGAKDAELRKAEKRAELMKAEKREEKESSDKLEMDPPSTNPDRDPPSESSRPKERNQGETSLPNVRSFNSSDAKPSADTEVQEQSKNEQPSADPVKSDHHKRGEDAVAAAKERFLARKKSKAQ